MIDSYESPWMDEELHIMRDSVVKFLQKEFDYSRLYHLYSKRVQH